MSSSQGQANTEVALKETVQSFQNLRQAARTLRNLKSESKDRALLAIAKRIGTEAVTASLITANLEDLDRLPESTTPAFRDRLTLTRARIAQMCQSLVQVAQLKDPVGEVAESMTLANGLKVRRERAPLGVIFMIFESRPNVILEAFSLAFKSGNTIALRGGSDSRSTAQTIYQIMREELASAGVGADSFYGFDNYDRALVDHLLGRPDLIDIVVPRGGDRLIQMVTQYAKMPIIKNDRGMCHAYVDIDADLEMAVTIVTNAKTQRPGVCNSVETVLVHKDIADNFLPKLYSACGEATAGTTPKGVEWRCDAASFAILSKNGPRVVQASTQDWDTEHLEQILNCRIVESLQEAMAHIEEHGSRHSEVIISENESHARRFQNEVDAAAVYWNASTRFTDGFELGLGGELGISTQKLHVRGPVGLRELTTPRWVIEGRGQVRN